jgi:hypothetical protein
MFLGIATEEHSIRQDDKHHAFVFQKMEAVEEEGEVSGRLWGPGRDSWSARRRPRPWRW